MYLIGGIASGYGGYLLNVCYQPGKDINYFLNRLDQVMAAPFANYWNETSLKARLNSDKVLFSFARGRERCDRNGHAVFLRPRVDFATTGSEITGISTSSTKLK